MHRDHHRWYSHRLGREMGINVYGHYGLPLVVFPTSGGDENRPSRILFGSDCAIGCRGRRATVHDLRPLCLRGGEHRNRGLI